MTTDECYNALEMLGKLVSLVRTEKGVSLWMLAKQSEIHIHTAERIEAGANANMASFIKYISALGVPIYIQIGDKGIQIVSNNKQ